MLAGLFNGLGMYCLTVSTKLASNPGLPDAVFSSQSLFTYLISLYFFGGVINIKKLLGIIFIIISIWIIKSTKLSTSNWVIIALLAGCFATIQDILKKLSLNNKTNTYTLILNFFITQFIVFFSLHLYEEKTFITKVNIKQFGLIALTALFFMCLTFTQIYAFNSINNVGLVKSISSIAVLLTTLLFEVYSKQLIHTITWVGLFICLFGIILIVN